MSFRCRNVVVGKGWCQLGCPPRHLTKIQNYEVCRQYPSFWFIVRYGMCGKIPFYDCHRKDRFASPPYSGSERVKRHRSLPIKLLFTLLRGFSTGDNKIFAPKVFYLKTGVERSQIVLSPVWCSKLRLTTGVNL
ncbi:hypothetical protein TNCV_4885571 [Trichonephila clavipes]|uniref:Uncharacterized protein n=1 Tax=Trichonephila clavipes TaxID=2585209 RepID=A0A8X6RQC6_TRICX|nr:hypothetical protein TNCV_4885571 [Trichonephila clavipes]